MPEDTHPASEERSASREQDVEALGAKKADPVRFLFVAWTMPPTAGGAAVVTRNLLVNFDPDTCVVLGQIPFPGRMSMEGFEQYRRIEVPTPDIYWRVKPFVEPFWSIPRAVRLGVEAVREHSLQAVVSIYPNAAMLYAAHRIAKKTGLPLLPHFHNLYAETRAGTAEGVLARRLQRLIFQRSTHVFTMSQGMTDYYRERYGVESTPLLHPMAHEVPEFSEPAPAERPYRLALSGNMNFTMLGKLARVVKAVGDDPGYEIVLHAPQTADRIREDLGVWADNITVKDARRQEDLVASLGSCDLLLIGLENRIGKRMDDDFRTQFPTRSLDMLVSGKPIMVLCPRDYYFARFFETHDCGFIEPATDPDTIKRSIDDLCADQERRSRYVRNALDVAQAYRGPAVAAVLDREMRKAVNGRES